MIRESGRLIDAVEWFDWQELLNRCEIRTLVMSLCVISTSMLLCCSYDYSNLRYADCWRALYPFLCGQVICPPSECPGQRPENRTTRSAAGALEYSILICYRCYIIIYRKFLFIISSHWLPYSLSPYLFLLYPYCQKMQGVERVPILHSGHTCPDLLLKVSERKHWAHNTHTVASQWRHAIAVPVLVTASEQDTAC